MKWKRCFAAVLGAIVVLVAARSPATTPAPAAMPRIEAAGAIRFPDETTGADGEAVAVTGLSGVAWLGGDRWVAVMDTGSAFVEFALDLDAHGRPRAVRDLRAVRFAVRHDYEDVVPCPAAVARRFKAGAGRLVVCEEDTPAIHVVDPRGAVLAEVPIPAILATRRPNRGLEALAVAAADGTLWTANEEALPTDGPPPTPGVGTVVRLVEIPLAAGADPRRGRHLAYGVDPPHAAATVGAGDVYSGVVALAMLTDGRLLVLERSAVRGLPPFENRLYAVDPAAAVDVAHVAGDLAARPAAIVAKQLAWRGSLGCNLEGLSVGPALDGGGRAVVAVADAGGLSAASQLVVLRMDPPLTSP